MKHSSFILFATTFLLIIACKEKEDNDLSPMPVESQIMVETIPISDNIYKGDDALSIDNKGNFYVSHLAGGAGRTIFKVTLNGDVSPFAENLSGPMGHAFDRFDNLYVAFNNSSTIAKIDTNGIISEFIKDAKFKGGSLYVEEDGTLYHTVFKDNKVYKISPEKEITEIAAGSPLNVPFGITKDNNDNIYIANFSNGVISIISPDGALNVLADLPTKIGYLIYANERLYATGFTDNKIYSITLDGSFIELIGTGSKGDLDGIGSDVNFNSPNGIAASSDGKTLYVTQKNFKIRKISL